MHADLQHACVSFMPLTLLTRVGAQKKEKKHAQKKNGLKKAVFFRQHCWTNAKNRKTQVMEKIQIAGCGIFVVAVFEALWIFVMWFFGMPIKFGLVDIFGVGFFSFYSGFELGKEVETEK